MKACLLEIARGGKLLRQVRDNNEKNLSGQEKVPFEYVRDYLRMHGSKMGNLKPTQRTKLLTIKVQLALEARIF